MKTYYLNAKGFTLLEVLIALVVLGVGMAALLQVQSSFLKGASDSEVASTAHILAEKKLEELRNFEDIDGFNLIVSGAAQDVAVSYGTGSFEFTWSWDVTAYTAAGLTTVSDAQTDYKEITVRVAPKDGSSPGISLSSIIARINPSNEPDLGSEGIGGGIPTVDYTAGEAPDVIAIELDETKSRETSKPLPETIQQGQNYTSTVVQFETVTFDSSNRLVTEDFATVNCLCEYATVGGDGVGLRPAKTKYDAEKQELTTEYFSNATLNFVSKATGTPAETGQSFLCDRCCRDHHDRNDPTDDKYRWYWPDEAFHPPTSNTPGDHLHYSYDGSSWTAITNPAVGDEYVENCRFKRVDGIYRLMQDWRMVDLTVLPSSYLASGASGNTKYKNYVVSVAEAALVQSYNSGNDFGAVSNSALAASVAKPSGRNLTDGDGELGSIRKDESEQVLARAIMLDPLTSDAVASIGALWTASSATSNWLDKIPFYEINTTLLSEWFDDGGGFITVQNEPVVTIIDPDNDYYGSYRRGLITGVSGGLGSVTASSAISNTGIVGHRTTVDDVYVWTDSSYDGNSSYQIFDSIQVLVTASGSSSFIKGDIDCLYIKTNGSLSACNASKAFDENTDLSVTAGGIYTCEIVKQSSASYYYECEIPSLTPPAMTIAVSEDGSSGVRFYVSDIAASTASLSLGYLGYTVSGALAPGFRVVVP